MLKVVRKIIVVLVSVFVLSIVLVPNTYAYSYNCNLDTTVPVYHCNNSPLNGGGTTCSHTSIRICNICNGNYNYCSHSQGTNYGGKICSPVNGICNICYQSYSSCIHDAGATYGGTVCSPYYLQTCNICNSSNCSHVEGTTYNCTYHIHTGSCPFSIHTHTSSCINYGCREYVNEPFGSINCLGYAFKTSYASDWFGTVQGYWLNPGSTMDGALALTKDCLKLQLALLNITFEDVTDLGGEEYNLAPDEWLVCMRIGKNYVPDEDNPSQQILKVDFHFWYRTSTGVWADKHGPQPSELLYGDSPTTVSSKGWAYKTTNNFYDSPIVYYKVKNQ